MAANAKAHSALLTDLNARNASFQKASETGRTFRVDMGGRVTFDVRSNINPLRPSMSQRHLLAVLWKR